MKKFLSLLLALVLVCTMFSLVSCDQSDKDKDRDKDNKKSVETLNGKTPEELYLAAQETLKIAPSYSVETTQVITMSYQGESMVMNQEVFNKINGDDSYVKTSNDMDSSMSMEAWYVDGVVYAAMNGMKVKANVDKEEFMQQYMGKDPSESTLLDIPESWFKDIKFEKSGDAWVLNFVVSGEEYTQYFENVGLGGEISGNVKHKVYFDKDGNLEKVDTTFDMSVQGIDAHCVSTSIITIETVTITPPADADSYQWTQLS